MIFNKIDENCLDEQKYNFQNNNDDQNNNEFKPFKKLPQTEECKVAFESQDLSPHISHVDSSLFADQNSKNNQYQQGSLINKKFLDYIKIRNLVTKFKAKLFEQSKLLTVLQKQRVPINILKFEQFYNQNNNQSFQAAKSIMLFNSEGMVLKIIDKLLLLFLLGILLLVPFIWSFESEDEMLLNNITYIFNFVIATDILLKFNTSIIRRGKVINDRIEIVQLRLKSFFYQDIFFIGSLNYLNYSNDLFYLILFYFIGFIKFSDSFDNLIDFFDFSSNILEIVSLIKLLITILLVSHAIACIWHYVGLRSLSQDDVSWLSVKHLENEVSSTKYIYSFYWAIVTMITVGYGDICPQNKIEVVSSTLIMLFSCGVYAFSLNKIGQVIQNLSDLSESKRESMRTISSFMKYHQVSTELQGKVRNYLEYQFGLQRIQNKVDVQKIIGSLSSDLKHEIMTKVFDELTKNSQFFHENFNQNMIKKFSSHLKLNFYAPDHTISLQSDLDDQSIYFIDYGTVSLIEEKSNTIICDLKRGQFFGEQYFFTGTPQKLTLLSKTFSRVYIIKRSELITDLNYEEYLKFSEISQNFLFNRPIKGYICQVCKKSSHNISNCNLFNYVPDCEKIILKYKFATQNRFQFLKRNRKKTRCLQNLQTILRSQNIFLINNDDQNSINSQKSEQTLKDISKEESSSQTSQIPLNLVPEKSRPSLLIKRQGHPSFEKNDSLGKKTNQFESRILNQENTKVTSAQFDLLQPQRGNSEQKGSKNFIKPQNYENDFENFDKMKLFSSFFPNNNYDTVIENFNLVNKYIFRKNHKPVNKYHLFPGLSQSNKSENGTQKKNQLKGEKVKK